MKKKSNLVTILLIILALIILGILGFCGYKYYEESKIPTMNYQAQTKTFELNELVKASSLITIVDGTLADDQIVATDKIGTFNLTLTLQDLKGNNTNVEVTYSVIDTIAPTIEISDTIQTYVGTALDLFSLVKVEDNYDSNVSVEITGDYSFDEEGEYLLTIIATDSSNNKATKEFTLKVMKKSVVIDYTENYEARELIDGVYLTSKGYTVEVVDHVAYINGLVIANKSYNVPASYGGSSIAEEAMEAFNQMAVGAKEEGLTLTIVSGHRSYNYQKQLYNNYCKRDGQAEADRYSARPGYSEHQTGYGMDLNQVRNAFKDTVEGKWLAANAWKYGFILRYPEGKEPETGYMFEPWHYRYVGIELATELYNDGDWITMEDYFGIDSNYDNNPTAQ